jgi:hypothetical protein
MLRLRRSLQGPENKISNPLFGWKINLLVVVSSDSQVGHKFGNDRLCLPRIFNTLMVG